MAYSPQVNRWAVATLFAINGLIMGAWAIQIPLLLPRHTITESILGLLILCLGLGAVTAMLFAGRLIARFGSTVVATLFTFAAIPMLLLVVLAPNLWLLAPLMALFGALIGCMDVAMNANAVQVERRMGRAIMSSSHGFWSLGGFVGGAGGAWIVANLGAERQALIVLGLTLLMAVIARPFLLQDLPAPRTADAAREKAPLIVRSRALWILGVMALFSMVPEGAVLDWAAIYLSKELNADLFTAGLGFAMFSGTMAVMRFAGDGIRNRYGAVKTLQISAALGAAGLALGAMSPTAPMAIAGFAIAGLGVANMVPILFSAAGNMPGLPQGVGISTVTMVGYAGILIVPSTIGFVAEHVGFRATYLTLAFVLAVVGLMAARAAAADDLQKG